MERSRDGMQGCFRASLASGQLAEPIGCRSPVCFHRRRSPMSSAEEAVSDVCTRTLPASLKGEPLGVRAKQRRNMSWLYRGVG